MGLVGPAWTFDLELKNLHAPKVDLGHFLAVLARCDGPRRPKRTTVAQHTKRAARRGGVDRIIYGDPRGKRAESTIELVAQAGTVVTRRMHENALRVGTAVDHHLLVIARGLVVLSGESTSGRRILAFRWPLLVGRTEGPISGLNRAQVMQVNEASGSHPGDRLACLR